LGKVGTVGRETSIFPYRGKKGGKVGNMRKISGLHLLKKYSFLFSPPIGRGRGEAFGGEGKMITAFYHFIQKKKGGNIIVYSYGKRGGCPRKKKGEWPCRKNAEPKGRRHALWEKKERGK